jgi:ribosome biogenesis GTPase A
VSVSPIECCKLINGAGHGRVLRSVYRLLLNRGNDSKRYVCWLYGIANSGKSLFIRRLRKIFASDEVDWRGEYLPVNDTNKRHIKP